MAAMPPKPPAPEAGVPGHRPTFLRVQAVIVALENYRKSAKGTTLPTVDYAHADAEAFAASLREIYKDMPQENVHIEIIEDSEASLVALEDLLGYTTRGLDEGDLFIFYYAGHGFHGPLGNRLSAYDTNPHNLAATSLHLRDKLLEPLAQSHCQQALVFVDACSERFCDLVASRDIVSDLDPEEVRNFLDSGWYCGVFLSCSPGEKSYPSSQLGHGVWTHFLLQALTGKAQGALTHDRWLTDFGLRDYLRQEVPRFITREMSVRGTQTPQAIISGSNSFRIRYLPVPPKTPPNAALAGIKLKNQSEYLEGSEIGAIRTLAGFQRKIHTVPDHRSDSADTWVRRLLDETVSKELQHVYERAKNVLNVRRQDLRKAVDTGAGDLDAPAFRYSVETGQHLEDPSKYVIYRRLELRQGWIANRAAIDDIFGNKFDQLIVEFDSIDSDFDELVAKIEDICAEHGGTIKDDDRKQRVSYSRDNATFMFDLMKRRLEISFKDSHTLRLVDAIQQFQLGLAGIRSSVLPAPESSHNA